MSPELDDDSTRDVRSAAAPFDPATILVTACPAVGQEKLWEQSLGELVRASLSFPGHLGTTVLKPVDNGDNTYRVITKFDSIQHMENWRDSDERRQRVDRITRFQMKPADIRFVTGMETWFDLPHHGEPHAIVPPPKYKMALIVWLAVFFAVIPVLNVLRTLTSELPGLVGSAIGVTTSVVLMTWIVMPLLSWVFRFWLYPAMHSSA